MIGDCDLALRGEGEARLGWILRRDRWNQGYGTEVCGALLRFGFETLGLRRIVALCDAENHGSYRVMEKNGMRREGFFFQTRRANPSSGEAWRDEYLYAMLTDEWDIRKEIACYTALPAQFDGFIEVPLLTDGEIELVCTGKKPANPEKKHVPTYWFDIHRGGERIGTIDLRIGYSEGLYYGGQIGYGVDEAHRGHGYAAKACRLLAPVMRAHGMSLALITNDIRNAASRRVCEKIPARLVRVARVPEWHGLYRQGQRWVNIFEWMPEKEH